MHEVKTRKENQGAVRVSDRKIKHGSRSDAIRVAWLRIDFVRTQIRKRGHDLSDANAKRGPTCSGYNLNVSQLPVMLS